MTQQIEAKHQAAVIKFLALNHVLVFHVPNEGQRNPIAGALLKKIGMLKGAPDLVLCLDKKVVFVEMKDKDGRQSPEQKVFQSKVENLGIEYHIWHSVDDAAAFLRKERGKKK